MCIHIYIYIHMSYPLSICILNVYLDSRWRDGWLDGWIDQ